MRILAVCGSLQKASGNRDLIGLAVTVAPPGVQVVPFDGVRELPHFDPDLLHGDAPPAVLVWRAALQAADAVLIASPEYGHSLPGALKNAVDWVIGSGEFHRKVVGVTAAVPQPNRGRAGLAALIQTLKAVDADVIGGDPIARGPQFEAQVRALLTALHARVAGPHEA